MVKKRGRALVCLALACAVLVGGLVACEQTQNGGPDQAVEELENTITYDGQTVSFTLPEGKRDWSLHIAGRAEVEWLGGMSLHYLDETAWTPGRPTPLTWTGNLLVISPSCPCTLIWRDSRTRWICCPM